MVSFAIGLLLTAVLLQVLAAVVPGLEFDTLAATMGAALVMSMVGWGTGLLYMAAAVQLIIDVDINLLALMFASAVVSGMHVTGGAAVITAVMLTILEHAIPVLMTLDMKGMKG
jgi:uncharacterized membrane protein YvlD (DUF360 family)